MNKNYESKNIIEATGTKEIISDLEAFDSVDKVFVISIPKSEKSIWPKINIVIANDYSLNQAKNNIEGILIKYDFPKTQVSLQQKNVTCPYLL